MAELGPDPDEVLVLSRPIISDRKDLPVMHKPRALFYQYTIKQWSQVNQSLQ